MKHKWLLLLLTVVLTLSLVMTGCAEEKEKTARFSFGQWTGDWLTIYVPKILLEEELGYTTEIAELSVPAIWTAMAAAFATILTAMTTASVTIPAVIATALAPTVAARPTAMLPLRPNQNAARAMGT